MSDQAPPEPYKKKEYEHYDKSFTPRSLLPEDHEHYLQMAPGERFAKCECGFGGAVYPHNAVLKDGHVYNLEGKKIV